MADREQHRGADSRAIACVNSVANRGKHRAIARVNAIADKEEHGGTDRRALASANFMIGARELRRQGFAGGP